MTLCRIKAFSSEESYIRQCKQDRSKLIKMICISLLIEKTKNRMFADFSGGSRQNMAITINRPQWGGMRAMPSLLIGIFLQKTNSHCVNSSKKVFISELSLMKQVLLTAFNDINCFVETGYGPPRYSQIKSVFSNVAVITRLTFLASKSSRHKFLIMKNAMGKPHIFKTLSSDRKSPIFQLSWDDAPCGTLLH